ncbi:hypothetical protein MASR1M8_23750 [Thermomonas brevis]
MGAGRRGQSAPIPAFPRERGKGQSAPAAGKGQGVPADREGAACLYSLPRLRGRVLAQPTQPFLGGLPPPPAGEGWGGGAPACHRNDIDNTCHVPQHLIVPEPDDPKAN